MSASVLAIVPALNEEATVAAVVRRDPYRPRRRRARGRRRLHRRHRGQGHRGGSAGGPPPLQPRGRRRAAHRLPVRRFPRLPHRHPGRRRRPARRHRGPHPARARGIRRGRRRRRLPVRRRRGGVRRRGHAPLQHAGALAHHLPSSRHPHHRHHQRVPGLRPGGHRALRAGLPDRLPLRHRRGSAAHQGLGPHRGRGARRHARAHGRPGVEQRVRSRSTTCAG